MSLIMLVVLLAVGIGADWFDTWLGNKVEYIDRKIDDATSYETLKKVEDTCRAMQASYESDRLTYEQYKDSDNEEKQSWAEQAKMRANKTAATYNSYILENSFVWKDAVPDDIRIELPILN
ncbi:MAG: hypothetical protein J6N18_01420 [Kiritimatiellae bacterium]|nr:hypothetical protein [Kiritimatiellia bacterium]